MRGIAFINHQAGFINFNMRPINIKFMAATMGSMCSAVGNVLISQSVVLCGIFEGKLTYGWFGKSELLYKKRPSY